MKPTDNQNEPGEELRSQSERKRQEGRTTTRNPNVMELAKRDPEDWKEHGEQLLESLKKDGVRLGDFWGLACFRGYCDFESQVKIITGQIEKLLRCSKPTALKEMEALAVLGIADKTEGDAEYGRPEQELRLAEKFQWFTTDECESLRWP